MSSNGQDEQQGGLSSATMSVTVDGRRYDMKMGDFSAMDEVEFRNATGTDLMTPFATGQINSIVVAGLVWRARVRAGERKLTFDTVARQVRWRDLDGVEVTGLGNDEDEPPPPPPPRPGELTSEVPAGPEA